MAALRQWWNSRSRRDRRALAVLLVVVPVILFWYLVTRPLNDRLLLARRVLHISRQQAVDLQQAYNEYAQLSGQVDAASLDPSSEVLVVLENGMRKLDNVGARPVLNRVTLNIAGVSYPGAQLRLDRATPERLWQIMQILEALNMRIADLELTSDPANNSFNTNLKLWLPGN